MSGSPTDLRGADRQRRLMAHTHMYVPIPASHSIRIYSFFRSARGMLCCLTWSSLVRFRPKALKSEETRTMRRPRMVFCRG
jgi:hypothetical protein